MENTTRCSESVSPIQAVQAPVLPCKSPSLRHCFAVQISITEDTAAAVGIMLLFDSPHFLLTMHAWWSIDRSTLSSSVHHRLAGPRPGECDAMPIEEPRSTPRKVAVASCCWLPNNSRIETALVLSHKWWQVSVSQSNLRVFSLLGAMCHGSSMITLSLAKLITLFSHTLQKERLGTETSKNEALFLYKKGNTRLPD